MDETDGKGELNWYRTNIYRYYGGYELKFNRKRMWKRKYGLWTKVKDNQLEKFIIVRNWRLPSWMSSEIFKSCTKNWLTNELFTLSHCNNGSVMWEYKISHSRPIFSLRSAFWNRYFILNTQHMNIIKVLFDCTGHLDIQRRVLSPEFFPANIFLLHGWMFFPIFTSRLKSWYRPRLLLQSDW